MILIILFKQLAGYVVTNDMKGLEKYYNQLLGDCQRVNNFSSLNPSIINNPSIYSILASKYHLADEKGIQINLEVLIDLSNLKVPVYEFTRILRNFIR